MSIETYFINRTKKIVVSSKKIMGGYEDAQQLLCYLTFCVGDTIKLLGEDSKWVHPDGSHAKVRANHENPWVCNAWKEIG